MCFVPPFFGACPPTIAVTNTKSIQLINVERTANIKMRSLQFETIPIALKTTD